MLVGGNELTWTQNRVVVEVLFGDAVTQTEQVAENGVLFTWTTGPLDGWVGIRKLASTADQSQSPGSAGQPNSCQEFKSTPGHGQNGANPEEMPELAVMKSIR